MLFRNYSSMTSSSPSAPSASFSPPRVGARRAAPVVDCMRTHVDRNCHDTHLHFGQAVLRTP